jgi:outer membrane protein, heavy metal efflux system
MQNKNLMRHYHKIFIGLSLFFVTDVDGQNGLDSVLAQIRENNFSIKASGQFIESEKWRVRAGNSLYNPVIEYDYLRGRPEGAGIQKEFSIIQSFDFPTVYLQKNKAAQIRATQLDHESTIHIQDVLLQAKLICLEIIYRNKLKTFLDTYQKNAELLVSVFERKLETGEGNILDVNKSKLMLFEARTDAAENQTKLIVLQQKLKEKNGGKEIQLNDTTYPVVPVLASFETHEKEFEDNDAVRKSLESEIAFTQQQVKVARGYHLPKMEVGYHYQGILGQEFSGIHSGITIPLWENRNTLKLNKAMAMHAELELQSHRSEHFTEIRNLYDQYLNYQKMLAEYQLLINQATHDTLMTKALTTGYISTIEYYMEISMYRSSLMRYFEMEFEYQKVVAELLRFRL